jgi:hypothetical protein
MKSSSLLFSAAIPATVVALIAGAPALPLLAFVATGLILVLAYDDYGRRPNYGRPRVRAIRRRRAAHARLPLAA